MITADWSSPVVNKGFIIGPLDPLLTQLLNVKLHLPKFKFKEPEVTMFCTKSGLLISTCEEFTEI